jgi:sugar phosphate isomerase/epimerase
MTNRRNFLKSSGALALGSIFFPEIIRGVAAGSQTTLPGIGIQTFTLNALINSDTPGTLKKLAEIGFKNIEIASYSNGMYFGYKPKEFKTLVESFGLKLISCHVLGLPFDKMMPAPANPTPEQKKQLDQVRKMISPDLLNITDNAQQIADGAAEAGIQYVVCASTAIKTTDQIKQAADTFSKAGAICKKSGLQFAYHNHATEWDLVEGKTAYDFILSQTDKNLVKLELDLGWVATAKKDPIELFNGNPGRFPLWHVKDFNLATNTIMPIGQGNIDFNKVFANADLAGMKYFFYEQDNAKGMDDVTTSYNNLKKILDTR